jgi:hypothetical protein
LSALFMSCCAAVIWCAELALMARRRYFSTDASWAEWMLVGPWVWRALLKEPPATAPTSSVTTAATPNRARLRRRTARTARVAARISATPIAGSAGNGRAARKPWERAARPAASSLPWVPPCGARSMAWSRASASARSSLAGSSRVTGLPARAAFPELSSAACGPRRPSSRGPRRHWRR